MAPGYDWDLFSDGDGLTEIHHKGCPERDHFEASGDANATGVIDSEPMDEYDTSCGCLDPLLGGDR